MFASFFMSYNQKGRGYIRRLRIFLILGICIITLFNTQVLLAQEQNKVEHLNKITPIMWSKNINTFESEKENLINVSYKTARHKCTVQFNKVGSYSVYEENRLKNLINTELYNTSDISHKIGDVIDNYVYIGGSKMCSKINIRDLETATTYTYYVYKGQEPVIENLIKKITVATKPEKITLKENSVSSKEVKMSWNPVRNADSYDIYRDNKMIKTLGVKETSFKDTISFGKTYEYQVKACFENKDIDKNSELSNTLKIRASSPMSLPSVSGVCKTWANYQAVTAKSSPQYKLLHSDECYTDPKTGIRMVDDCYCVALGSYYGTKIGQKYIVKLSSGKQFKAILCDQKADRHTDGNNQYALNNRDIIEFYIDRRYKPSCVDGSYNSLPQFRGAVVSIEKIN